MTINIAQDSASIPASHENTRLRRSTSRTTATSTNLTREFTGASTLTGPAAPLVAVVQDADRTCVAGRRQKLRYVVATPKVGVDVGNPQEAGTRRRSERRKPRWRKVIVADLVIRK
jgi:hypothetical protein